MERPAIEPPGAGPAAVEPIRRPSVTDLSQPRTAIVDLAPRPPEPPQPRITPPYGPAVPSAAHAPPSPPPPSQHAANAAAAKALRAQTVALSEEDLEEVREAARLADLPSRPLSSSIPPPMPSGKLVEPRPRMPRPPSVPEIDLAALEDRAAEQSGEFSSGEFEVDVEGIVDARSAPIELPGSAGSAGSAAPVAPSAASSQPGIQAEPRSRHPSYPPGYGPPPPSAPSPRESQPIPVMRDPAHAQPPPPPTAPKAPPSPPPAKKERPAAARPDGKSEARADGKPERGDTKPGRGKAWFVDLFDEDYLRTLPFLTPQATQAEAEFVIDAMGLTPGAQVLDVGCGYGRHAMELAARGFHVVGLDISTPLLVRGGEEAHRRGLTINFVRGDMRELDFDAQFDGAYCLFSTFGYFDDETNKKTVANIARALRPGGRVLIEILNRDYVIADLPTRVWWEGDGCVVLEEVELNYFSSRIQVNRSVVFDDGRQVEQEISVRAYSLHEVGKLLHSAGFRVLEVSGAYHTRGRFFGNQSRHIIVLAERKEPAAS
jgi:SAM-dependent methyltransferase